MAAETRTVLITGASSGIGAATAERLLQTGWRVIAAARRTDAMQSLAVQGAIVEPLRYLSALLSRPHAPAEHVMAAYLGSGAYGPRAS